MKKKLLTTLLAACLSAATITTAFAGTWMQDAGGWWYQNDDGSYTTSNWQWIDGNGDGMAEAYYFDANGYCLMNTVTPDGYTVDASGAMVVNGVVQTQAVASVSAAPAAETQPAETTVTQTAAAAHTGISAEAYEGYTIVVNVNTGKYHYPHCNSVSDMKPENTGYCSDAAYLNANGYQPCKRCH